MPVDGKKNVRILIVTTVPETVKAFLLPQLKQLKSLGWELHIATGNCGCKLPELDLIGVREHRIPLTRNLSPIQDLKAILKLFRICKKFRFDLVHTHTLKASLVGQLAAYLAGVPVRVETVHGTRYMPQLPWYLKKIILLSEKIGATLALRVWVLNQEDYELFKVKKLAKPTALALLGKGGIGLDIERFKPGILTESQRLSCRQALGISPEDIVVGFVGRPVRDKGIYELLEAWPHVLKSVPKAHLLFITAQLASERSDELVSLQKIEELPRCTVLVNREDMHQLYNCMEIMVLPSYREGFSRVIIESLACGVPVVASDVRGCRDAVVSGVNGSLCPAQNAELFGQSIIDLLQKPQLRFQMAISARRYAELNFNQEYINKLIFEEYQKQIRCHIPGSIN